MLKQICLRIKLETLQDFSNFIIFTNRLTFWLSNSIMLRAIISQAAAGVQFNEGAPTETTGNRGRSALEKIYMQQSIKSIASQGNKSHLVKQYYNWEDIESFTQALEKLEAWIFSKITKSLWWQVDHLIFLSFSPITSATLFTVQSLIFACRL